jgi:hypothetical protein
MQDVSRTSIKKFRSIERAVSKRYRPFCLSVEVFNPADSLSITDLTEISLSSGVVFILHLSITWVIMSFIKYLLLDT